MESLLRKMKLLEEDLDNAEDRVADTGTKLKEQEALNDDLIRENKQLHHRVDTLEGQSVCTCRHPSTDHFCGHAHM